ncbi:anthranilate synthase family protein [Streptomyces sp. NPDC047315]|uniref:anthranilate synthase family protein n=1 Tax=Streptomyces sp. NPDC047315 TaxID=3155142 RepID=UPI00340F52DC
MTPVPPFTTFPPTTRPAAPDTATRTTSRPPGRGRRRKAPRGARGPAGVPCTGPDLLDLVLGPDAPPFALLHRPGATGPGQLDLIVGETAAVEKIADIPLPPDGGRSRHEVLALLPYRQIGERGFAFPDDGAPLLTMTVTAQTVLPVDDVAARLPDVPIRLDGAEFDADDAYAATVRRILTDEIGRGTGANFVIKRAFSAELTDYSPRTALSFYRRLLGRDPGSHWTFVIHTGERTFIGASPERHITLDAGTVVMNPISGTYRYPDAGPDLAEVLTFLADTKETNELYMVVDEELKMMARICASGGRVVGPALKQMARLAHTEYLIEGRSDLDVRDVLRETMFAPTVTGGPLESACRVISRYEPEGRGYYAGVVALIGRDATGQRSLDSSILIRTAEIDAAGRLRIAVGATLVRDSDPASEAAETRAKAAGLLEALRAPAGAGTAAAPVEDLRAHPDVLRALAERNRPLADFWFAHPERRSRRAPELADRTVLVIDAEDAFTAMTALILTALGCEVTVVRHDDERLDRADADALDAYDAVVLGPGPGDPTDGDDPKMARLRELAGRLLAGATPFLAICLGHQALSTVLGLDLARRDVPNQGVQRKIDVFGRTELVGFYNTYTAVAPGDRFACPVRGGTVEVFRAATGREVDALRGPGFASVQFHPESILTRNGTELIGDVLVGLLRPRTGGEG